MDRKTAPQRTKIFVLFVSRFFILLISCFAVVLKYHDRQPPLALLCVAGLPHLKNLVKLEADAKQSVPLLHSAIGYSLSAPCACLSAERRHHIPMLLAALCILACFCLDSFNFHTVSLAMLCVCVCVCVCVCSDLTSENTIIRYLARLIDSSLPSHLYGSDPLSASQVTFSLLSFLCHRIWGCGCLVQG